LVQGDITELTVDCIVNAANSKLILGGGVAGAIRKKGGPKIQEECNLIGGTPTGTAVITTGGNLKAKFVIHAVGPTGDMLKRDDLLHKAIKSSINLAQEKKLTSLALPAISTGIFGFPLEPASKIILETCIDEIQIHNEKQVLENITICLYDKQTFETFKRILKEIKDSKGH
jgi:O-acetyl-ADP-ribose deacetylase (regulator of RNase III)